MKTKKLYLFQIFWYIDIQQVNEGDILIKHCLLFHIISNHFKTLFTEKAHMRLQDVVSDDVINAMTEYNLIGDCVVHLGVELGISISEIRKIMYEFPRDLDGQIHALLIKWRKTSKPKPTIFRLMVALKRTEAAEGLAFLMKTYGVE